MVKLSATLAVWLIPATRSSRLEESMFKFSRARKFVLSQTNAVPLNAVDRILSIYYKLWSRHFKRGEVVRKDVTITMEPFASVVDAEGGKVHLALLDGHYEIDGVTHHFSASICVRLYENGNKSPSIAYEACSDVTINGAKFVVVFEAPDRFRFASMVGHEIRGSWRHSDEALPLSVLPCEPIHHILYGFRIRTLGHLKAWKRSQLLKESNDISVVSGAEKILAAFGYQFKPE